MGANLNATQLSKWDPIHKRDPISRKWDPKLADGTLCDRWDPKFGRWDPRTGAARPLGASLLGWLP